MKFLRNNWYWILSIVIGLGIGSIITMHRVQQQASETQQIPDVAKTPNVEVPRKYRPIRINKAARNTPALKSIVPISAANHNDIIEPPPPLSDDIIEPPPPLPDDIIEPPPPLSIDLDLSIDLAQRRNLMLLDLLEAHKESWGTQTGFCHVYVNPDAASQIELEGLIRDMNPEEAIALLEKYGWYNEAILRRVSAQRAFKYLHTIQPMGHKANEYAEKALAENPDNVEAKLKLILSEQDDAKAAARYREILAKNPNNVGALLNLGYRTHYDDPEGALVHLIKGNKLDPTRGLACIGQVYERLGDVKTAWLYYIKHLKLWPHDLLASSHLSWFNAGKTKYTPIYLERQLVPPGDEASMDKDTVSPKDKRIPDVKEMPWLPKLPPQETHPQENQLIAAEAAQAEFQRRHAAAQKEFDAFMKWVRSIMREDPVIATNDFLAKELAAHLKGDKTEVVPERLVRAFELIERHGRTRGLQRLKDKDPGLAAKVQRFLEEKQQPSRRNNQQNKNE